MRGFADLGSTGTKKKSCFHGLPNEKNSFIQLLASRSSQTTFQTGAITVILLQVSCNVVYFSLIGLDWLPLDTKVGRLALGSGQLPNCTQHLINASFMDVLQGPSVRP